MAEPVRRRLSQKPVPERLLPFLRMEVGGDQRGRFLVPCRHQVVKVFLLSFGQRLQKIVVDDQKRHLAQQAEALFEGPGGPGRRQTPQKRPGSRHQDVVSLADGLMPQSLGDVALAHPARPHQKHVGRLPHEVSRRQLRDHGPVESGMPREVEGVEGLVRPEPGPPQPLGHEVLLPPRHFVGDQKRQEVLVGEFPLDRLPVSGLECVDQAVEPQFLEHG